MVALVAVVVAGLGAPIPGSSAFLVDTDTTDASLTTETLDPPTSVTAWVNASLVTLTWTASPDAGADGYRVLRGTAAGGPYALVTTVTPATATSTTDTPGAGTWTYVLTTVDGTAPWQSPTSNETIAVVTDGGPLDTGLRPCSTQAATTTKAGDGNGFEVTPEEACDDDSVFAADVDSGTGVANSCAAPAKDRHRFGGFGLGVPTTATSILGIEVFADLFADGTAGNPTACIRLSWNGGTTWTAYTPLGATLTTTETMYLFGGAGSTWGRTWTGAELDDARFLVEIVSVTRDNSRDLFLDGLMVRVTYTP